MTVFPFAEKLMEVCNFIKNPEKKLKCSITISRFLVLITLHIRGKSKVFDLTSKDCNEVNGDHLKIALYEDIPGRLLKILEICRG